MKTGIYQYNRKGSGFELKRLVAMLLVLIQCASLAFVGVPVAYAEENLAPQDAVETVIGEAKQDPPPAQPVKTAVAVGITQSAAISAEHIFFIIIIPFDRNDKTHMTDYNILLKKMQFLNKRVKIRRVKLAKSSVLL